MPKTLYQLHMETWKNGCGAEICARAGSVVLARGKLPCDVLFVGEGPGESEDLLGAPFVGPAGSLLDAIIMDAVAGGAGVRMAFTNLVGCMPRNEDGTKSGEPSADDIKACTPRLEELIGLARPKLVVCVGKLSERWLQQGYKGSVKLPPGTRQVAITHPAAIQRANAALQDILIQRATITIRNAVLDLLKGK